MLDRHDLIVRRVVTALEDENDPEALVWRYFDEDRDAVVEAAQQTLEATREDASRARVEAAVDPELVEALRFPANPHAPRQIIVPSNSGSLAGWFAQLSSAFDPEFRAVTLEFDDAIDGKHEIIVHDSNGLVISRRVTRRSTDDRGGRRSP